MDKRTLGRILKSEDIAISTLLADPSIVEDLNLPQLNQVNGFLANATLRPEFKADFKWLQELMLENIQAAKSNRVNEAVKLRKRGLTLKQIGERLGLSGTRVSGMLRAV